MSLTLSNPFAALEVKKAKKSKDKDGGEKKKKKQQQLQQQGQQQQPGQQQHHVEKEDALRLEQEIFSRPQPGLSNWADCDDEDDIFDQRGAEPSFGENAGEEDGGPVQDDGHESEEEIDLEKEFGVELGNDDEQEPEKPENEAAEEEMQTDPETLTEQVRDSDLQDAALDRTSSRGPERTLSKKELKKKEMEELDAVLAELGITGADKGKKDQNGDSKKRRKKKNSLSMDAGSMDIQQELKPEAGNGSTSDKAEIEGKPLPNKSDTGTEESPEQLEEATAEESSEDADRVKMLKMKMLSSTGKKKSSKKMQPSSAAAAAAAEAKARSKKKGKKDTSHYNQAPSR